MAKSQKTNSGNGLNEGEIGSELPAANFPTETATAAEPAAAAETPSPKKEVKFKTVISGAEFWKFAAEKEGDKVDGDTFDGYYRADQKREKDGQGADQKAGSVIGYVFEQSGTGLNFLIGKSHAVEKALNEAGFPKDKLMRFVFLGKGKTAAGQPYNRFEILIEE